MASTQGNERKKGEMTWRGGADQLRHKRRQPPFGVARRSVLLPRTDDPHGIPKTIMRQLQAEGISDKVRYNRRLQELLAAHKQGGQHG